MTANMICTFAGVDFINKAFSSPINAGVLAMLVGLVLVPIVSLVTKKPDKALVDDMFSCYSKSVTVRSATALSDSTDNNK